MKKDVNSIDKAGFSNKFFEELEKEYEKIDSLASKQKELKQKHTQSTLR
ncbi:hypothetical protein [Candidatus Nitrosotenuis cloacae]|nr:hypothetical protein [Candidatus Nitrosotenuis cloacae]